MAKNEPKRLQGHYGLEFVLANTQATIMEVIEKLAKRNRCTKQDKVIWITPRERKSLELLQREKMKIRNRRAAERRGEALK